MAQTKIEWCDFSINPLRARPIGTSDSRSGHYCEKISPACRLCYASRLQPRFGNKPFDEAQAAEMEFFLDQGKLDQVRCRKKPTTYFWCDMTDIFGDWVPDNHIKQCLAVMLATPQHRHLILTKRELRASYWIRYLSGERNSRSIWFGFSAENQEYFDRRWYGMAGWGGVTFISYEPALGPLKLPHSFQRLGGRGWVIAGGESSPGAKNADLAWYRAVRMRCAESGVPFFMKQITVDGRKIPFEQFPPELQVREFPSFPQAP